MENTGIFWETSEKDWKVRRKNDMLQASGRKSRVITGVSKEGNALFLTSEAGIIRLIP